MILWRSASSGAIPRHPGPSTASDQEIHLWSEILDQAWEHELETAPRLLDYVTNAASAIIGVAGIGVALGPFAPVVAAVGAVIGLSGGAVSIASGIPLIHKDITTMVRLRAIERASRIVQAAAASRT